MGGRILLVDDQPEVSALLSGLLEAAGHTTFLATDGEIALAMLKENSYDLMILDLMMPRVLGFEVIQRVRQSIATLRLPIVVLSAKIYAVDQRKAMDMGATAFLRKPLDTHEVLSTVERVLAAATVTFWGVRGSIAAPGPDTVRYGGNTPCVTVEHQGKMVILDAGTGIRRLGLALQAAAKGKPLNINLLVTHTHWDHIQGFPFFVPAFVPGNTVNVVGPRAPDKPLARVLQGQMDPEYFPVALGDMAANLVVREYRGEPLEFDGIRVVAAYMNHPGVTLGYRMTLGNFVVAYATDTEPYRRHLPGTSGGSEAARAYGATLDQELVELARGADVYIADSQYFPDEYKSKVGWGHTCFLDAVDVACDAEVKRLVLFSHDPMHSDEQVDAKLARARERVAERGAKVEVIAASENVPLSILPG